MRLATILAPVGALLLFAATVPAAAQDWSGHGRVNGVVTDDETGKPIAGATVTLKRAEGPEDGPAPLTTDKKGRWSYLGLVGGNWKIQIVADGYVTREGPMHVDEFHPNPQVKISLRTLASVAPKQDPALAAALKAIDKGDELLQAKKPAEAQAEFEKALPQMEGANRAIILKRIATAQMLASDDAGAVESLKQALEIAPDDEAALKLIIDRLVVLHREEEAQQYMAKLPESAGLDPNTELNLGINDYNDNKIAEALEKFEKVVATKPDWPDGYYYRGLAHLANGQTEEAKADFEKVLALDPNSRFASDCKEFLKSL